MSYFRQKWQLGVTDFLSAINVENYPDFEKLAHVIHMVYRGKYGQHTFISSQLE